MFMSATMKSMPSSSSKALTKEISTASLERSNSFI